MPPVEPLLDWACSSCEEPPRPPPLLRLLLATAARGDETGHGRGEYR
jgi:hypothetical protein